MNQTLPDQAPAEFSPDTCHWQCCDDETVAMCGVDLTNHKLVGPEVPISCATCDEVIEHSDCLSLCPVQALRDMRRGSL